MLTLGSGAVTSLSQKQKINGKSLTKAQLISVDKALSQILWTRYFLKVMVMTSPKTLCIKITKVLLYLKGMEKQQTQKEPNT